MIPEVKTVNYFILVFSLSLLAACSSVRIHTGPPTEKQATETSEERGRGLRSQWADQLGRAQAMDKIWMVRQFIDSTDALLIRIGRQIADQWNEGEIGRGRQIPASEMREVISASVSTDQPLLEAYDDMVDYGVQEVRRTNFFDQETINLLLDMRDHYDKTHGEVLYPGLDRPAYEDNLLTLTLEAERLSALLEQDLRRYR